MKKITTLFMILLCTYLHGNAQIPYNPFTQNIHFSPEPNIAGFACGSMQTLSFTQGLTTSDDATLWQTDPLKVSICISGFEFVGPASSIVSGAYASNFSWAYAGPNCIVGTQNQTLFGTGTNPMFPNPLATGDINLLLKVPNTSPNGTVLSANVSLIIPSYMSSTNSLPDDNESTQTQTYCVVTVPTMSEWSLVILALLSLSFGIIFINKKQVLLSHANRKETSPYKTPIFNFGLFSSVLVVVLSLAVVLLYSSFIYFTNLSLTDTLGTLLSSTIVAYIIHLYILIKRSE